MKKTNEQFQNEFYSRYDKNEYELLGVYDGKDTPIKIIHKKCIFPTGQFTYDTTPTVLLDKRKVHLCPFCMGSYVWKENVFREYVSYTSPNIEPLNDFISGSEKMSFRCKTCNGIFQRTPVVFKNGKSGCPYCSKTKKKILVGYNDMWTTHPERAKYLKNPDDGFKYTYNTTHPLEWKCINCHHCFTKAPSHWVFDINEKFKCPNCKDGFSYPEKFISNMLSQIGVSYITQLSCTTFEWCERYRYDFYLPQYHMIIETHGIQHYEESAWDLQRNIENDAIKEDLALKNGIRHYVVIDCKYSDSNYIQNSIFQTCLPEILDLRKVDFELCNIRSISNYMKNIWEEWNNGNHNIREISKKYNIGVQTIEHYLQKGSECGQCTYDVKQNIRDTWAKTISKIAKPIYCIELSRLFISKSEVHRVLGSKIWDNAIDNPNKTSIGYHWRSATQQEIDSIDPYSYLNILNG